jgi:hypothetical protein
MRRRTTKDLLGPAREKKRALMERGLARPTFGKRIHIRLDPFQGRIHTYESRLNGQKILCPLDKAEPKQHTGHRERQ